MSAKTRQRLSKIEGALTPKQAVVLFLKDRAHRFDSIFKMHEASRQLPVSELPRPKIGRQVADSVRASMKAQGYKQPAIDQAVRRAVMDADFLLMLAVQCNQAIAEDSKANWFRHAHLAQGFRRMLFKDSASSEAQAVLDYLSTVPYPLFVDDATAVEAAIKNRVLTWRELEENRGFLSEYRNPVEEWVRQHFIRAGRKAIPLSLHAWRQFSGVFDPEKEPELRERFAAEAEEIGDPAAFEGFISGRDFTQGLADVTDSEFEAVYTSIIAKLGNLVEAGDIRPGRVVAFESVPLSFLDCAPLLEDEWLDAHVAELAEWGALLLEKGYIVVDDADDHPLSIAAILEPESEDEEEADANWLDVLKVREEARRRLSKFKGRTKVIDGRTCLSFADYERWKGRKAKPTRCGDGFAVASFNRWVELNQGSDHAVFAGCAVDKIVLDQGSFITLNHATDTIARQQERRAVIRRIKERLAPGVGEEELHEWREEVTSFAAGLHCLRDAIKLIEQKYLDATPVLFDDIANDLRDQIDRVESLVDLYNAGLRSRLALVGKGKAPRIDRLGVLNAAAVGVPKRTAFLVDRAKVDTFWAFDDVQGALELLWAHESGTGSPHHGSLRR